MCVHTCVCVRCVCDYFVNLESGSGAMGTSFLESSTTVVTSLSGLEEPHF